MARQQLLKILRYTGEQNHVLCVGDILTGESSVHIEDIYSNPYQFEFGKIQGCTLGPLSANIKISCFFFW